MNHPLVILRTLDSFLTRETRIVLYGRAALALGFAGAPAEFGVTRDVDAILPAAEMTAIEADEQFWQALDRANHELEPSGLYVTHLFVDEQVILSPGWLGGIVPLSVSGLERLRAFRPSVLDLVLTKMMRRDPQDLADIKFLLRQESFTEAQIKEAFARALCPDIDEIRNSFVAMQPSVLEFVRRGANPGRS